MVVRAILDYRALDGNLDTRLLSPQRGQDVFRDVRLLDRDRRSTRVRAMDQPERRPNRDHCAVGHFRVSLRADKMRNTS